jgi:hypothetical protein
MKTDLLEQRKVEIRKAVIQSHKKNRRRNKEVLVRECEMNTIRFQVLR